MLQVGCAQGWGSMSPEPQGKGGVEIRVHSRY